MKQDEHEMPAKDAPRPTILVVEDHEDTFTILRFLLERGGYAVRHAADGRQAQELVSTIAPTVLVVLDVMLPFLSGLQLIGFIRKQPQWRSVPILMLTSDATERDVVLALDEGANDYVTKPFNPKELLARVHRLAGRPTALAS